MKFQQIRKDFFTSIQKRKTNISHIKSQKIRQTSTKQKTALKGLLMPFKAVFAS